MFIELGSSVQCHNLRFSKVFTTGNSTGHTFCLPDKLFFWFTDLKCKKMKGW